MRRLRLEGRSYRRVKGKYYGSPKEVWGFRIPSRRRKAREITRRKARKIAEDFLRANAKLFKLDKLFNLEKDRDLLRFRKVKRSLGAWHVIFYQRWRGLRIHRAYVTVHMDNTGHVYMAKNRAMPWKMLPKRAEDIKFPVDEATARRRALKAMKTTERNVFDLGVRNVWFPWRAKLFPAYRFRLQRKKPREEWIIYVNGQTGGQLLGWDNLAQVCGRGRVFDPNPVADLAVHEALGAQRIKRLKTPPFEAYKNVLLRGLKEGEYLEGRYVTTRPAEGPANRTRREFCFHPARQPVRSPKREFCFESGQRGFEEVMAYYHIDTAARYLESLGFRGSRAILRKPLEVDACGTREDNSWYSPGLRSLTFGYGGINDAEDGEVILHELGHALQDAICPDFGQSLEAAAMGEGFGDYLAASFFAHKKATDYRTSVISWGIPPHRHTPACLRRVDEDRGYGRFCERSDYEHTNGKIWSATLWDIREALGREKADTLIIESHFQLDGFTTFARGARAILDSAQNLYGLRSARARGDRRRLVGIFHRRQIRPVTRWD